MTDGRRELSVFISHKLEDAEVALAGSSKTPLAKGSTRFSARLDRAG